MVEIGKCFKVMQRRKRSTTSCRLSSRETNWSWRKARKLGFVWQKTLHFQATDTHDLIRLDVGRTVGNLTGTKGWPKIGLNGQVADMGSGWDLTVNDDPI